MEMKSLSAALALFVFLAVPASAAGLDPILREARRIETKAAQARTICQDRRRSPKNQSEQICRRYGICHRNVPCERAVRAWQERAMDNLKKRPGAKVGPAATPQQETPPSERNAAPPVPEALPR